MFDLILDRLGSFGNTWATWLGVSILDAAIMLVLAAAVWLLVRKKASAQFGYCLFLLVLLKLFVPLEVVVPKQLARWTPAHMVSTAITASSITETASPETKLPDTKFPDNGPTMREGGVQGEMRDGRAGFVRGRPPAQSPRDHREPLEMTLEDPLLEHVASEADASPLAASPVAPVIAKPQAARGYASVFACLMLVWAAGACFMLVRFLCVQVRFHRHLKEANPLDLAVLGVDFAELCARIGIRRPVRVVETASMASPAVWGIWRPVVILPRGMSASLSPKQLQWILLHELAHIRRHDLAVTCFQRLITIVHFVNPAVWIANRMINRLREYACDDMALALTGGSPIESSEAFMHVVSHAAKNRLRLAGRMDAALGVFDSGGRATCFQRMSRLLDTNRRPQVRLGLVSIGTLLLAAILTLPQIRAGDDSPAAEKPAVEKTAETAQAKKPEPAEQPVMAAGDAARGPGGAEKAKTVARKDAARRFALTVVGPDGKAVADARVEVRMRPTPKQWNVTPGKFLEKGEYGVFMTADADGRLAFELPGRKPASFNLFISTKGFAPFCARWDNSEHAEPIPPGYTAHLDAGRSVGGIIVNGKGEPIEGVTIRPSIEFKNAKVIFASLASGGE